MPDKSVKDLDFSLLGVDEPSRIHLPTPPWPWYFELVSNRDPSGYLSGRSYAFHLHMKRLDPPDPLPGKDEPG